MAIAGDHIHLQVEFTGAKTYIEGDRCSADYAAETEIVDGALVVGIFVARTGTIASPPGYVSLGCDAIGFGRQLKITLPAPYDGNIVRDRVGYVFLLARPDWLAEFDWPAGYRLIGESTVGESRFPRWLQSFALSRDAPGDERIDFDQTFGGAPLAGEPGQLWTTVAIGDINGQLYSYAPAHHWTLVWTQFDSVLQLEGTEPAVTAQSIVALAATAQASGSTE